MKTVFIAIAFGTSIRDVLRNDTYKALLKHRNLRIVIFAQDISQEVISGIETNDNVFFEQISKIKPTFIERALLHFHRATLRDRCKTIDLGNTSGETKTLDRITPLARLTLKLLGEKGTNSLIFKLYKNFAKRIDHKEVFEKYNPDLVVVTRVLNYSADYPIMRTAEQLKVPVMAFVSSWDNLTSKAFFPFSLKHLVVWNHVLKEEAISLFSFPENRISVTGIPRYDLFFRRQGFRTKSEFMKSWGLDENTKLICYCTGSKDVGKSPLDPITPEPNIAKFIAENCNLGEFGANCKVIIRLHPQANPDHYQDLEKMENVIVNIPGKLGAFQDRVFTEEEDVEFGELMNYSDVVVNFASTVTIDAAVFDTPIIGVNFDFNGERPYKISPRRIYDFDHYAKLIKMEGFLLANSREELKSQIKSYLNNPSLTKEGRLRIVDQQCVFRDGQSGNRNASIILKELRLN